MEIKEWVLQARTKANLTQTQLGDAMGVTKGNVSAWENARHEPSWSQMLKICEITGATLPVPAYMQLNKSGWPFSVSYDLFAGVDEDARADIDGLVGFAVQQWYEKVKNKSKKAG